MHEALAGDYSIPTETKRLATTIFPNGNVYMRMYDHFGTLVDNAQFVHLFSKEGHPSLAPARLAIVTIMQYMEGVSDTQAADQVRDRITWKYALGLSLEDTGFHSTALGDFRQRLITGNAEMTLFTVALDLFRDAGLLKSRGKQRTDSTHVLAAIRDLNRLELVGETMRHVLDVLAMAAPDWLLTHADRAWVDRYATRMEEYRLPKEKSKRVALAEQIGQDGATLLDTLAAPTTPAWIRDVPAVVTLREIWQQQYVETPTPTGVTMRWREQADLPPCRESICSPYDPEARCATKRETTWIGYKVHLTETCDDDAPSIITHVETTPATTNDVEVVDTIQTALAEHDLLPQEHYVDTGYMDAENLITSQETHQVQLIGPVLPDSSWQARAQTGYDVARFTLDWESHQATCPQGNTSVRWTPGHDNQGTGLEMVMIQFAEADCAACLARTQCTQAKEGPRTMKLRTQAQHEALHQARQMQRTATWKNQYKRRAGVEGTFAQANRRCDVRYARYRGWKKTHVQHLFTALALNFFRVLAWLAEKPRARTRISAFSRLMAASL
jgi:transposase